MHQLKWMSYDVEFSLFCFVESVCVSLIRYAHNRLADCSSLVFETDLKIIVCTSDSLKLQSWLVQWGLCFVGNRNRIYETHPLADQCRSYIHTGTSAHVHPHKYTYTFNHTRFVASWIGWCVCVKRVEAICLCIQLTVDWNLSWYWHFAWWLLFACIHTADAHIRNTINSWKSIENSCSNNKNINRWSP